MKQLLIVEDDALLNKTLCYNLSADGFGIASALNVKTAREQVQSRIFDLVLLDVGLPDGNGFDLCRELKSGALNALHSDTPVIFLTANDGELDQLWGYEVAPRSAARAWWSDCEKFSRQTKSGGYPFTGGWLGLFFVEYTIHTYSLFTTNLFFFCNKLILRVSLSWGFTMNRGWG